MQAVPLPDLSQLVPRSSAQRITDLHAKPLEGPKQDIASDLFSLCLLQAACNV